MSEAMHRYTGIVSYAGQTYQWEYEHDTTGPDRLCHNCNQAIGDVVQQVLSGIAQQHRDLNRATITCSFAATQITTQGGVTHFQGNHSRELGAIQDIIGRCGLCNPRHAEHDTSRLPSHRSGSPMSFEEHPRSPSPQGHSHPHSPPSVSSSSSSMRHGGHLGDQPFAQPYGSHSSYPFARPVGSGRLTINPVYPPQGMESQSFMPQSGVNHFAPDDSFIPFQPPISEVRSDTHVVSPASDLHARGGDVDDRENVDNQSSLSGSFWVNFDNQGTLVAEPRRFNPPRHLEDNAGKSTGNYRRPAAPERLKHARELADQKLRSKPSSSQGKTLGQIYTSGNYLHEQYTVRRADKQPTDSSRYGWNGRPIET